MLTGAFLQPDDGAMGERLARFIAGGVEGLATWLGARRIAGDPRSAPALIERDIVALDQMIAAQLDSVLHHPRLQRLEGSWRGLEWLVSGIDARGQVKTRILDAGWSEICRDLDRAPEFDQSVLFRKIYEDEFGRAGGEPFGLLVIDEEVSHQRRTSVVDHAPPDDIAAISSLAALAAAAFVPVVIAASPHLLGVDHFDELALSLDPAAPLRDTEHRRWQALTARSDMRFLCLTMPRVLARPLWTPDSLRDRWHYAESAGTPRDRVWCLGGYAFASVVIRAQEQFGWPADIRGVDKDRLGGGLVPDLPRESYTTDRGGGWSRPSLDLALTESQEQLLIEGGLMPIAHLPQGGEAFFASVRSLHSAPGDAVPENARAMVGNARLSAQINSMLCVSRFAHYIKVMGREMIGSFLTAEEIERRLQRWLAGYTNGNNRGDAESRARYPLASSKVRVAAHAARPGTFACTVHLQPCYQLDDVETTFQLATEFVLPGAGLVH